MGLTGFIGPLEFRGLGLLEFRGLGFRALGFRGLGFGVEQCVVKGVCRPDGSPKRTATWGLGGALGFCDACLRF